MATAAAMPSYTTFPQLTTSALRSRREGGAGLEMSSEWSHLQSPELLCTGLHLEKEHGEDRKKPGGGQLTKRCGQTESDGES